MNENASSNITQILTSFETFICTYNDPLWVKNTTTENIKSIFKLGCFIEKCIEKFQNKNYISEFMKVLEKWCQEKNIKYYNVAFFTVANDQILEKVFKYDNVKETTLDISIRVYCSIYPKERFKVFLERLITKCSSTSAIIEFVNFGLEDSSNLKNTIILNKWNEFIINGKEDVLKSELDSYVSLYKVADMLPKLFNMLCVSDSSNTLNPVKTIILNSILNKMCDRSLLTKNFWLTLFKVANREDIGNVACNYKLFLESIMNFIEYVGSMFQKDVINVCEWKSDLVLSLYPEINYFDILSILKTIINIDSDKGQYISDRLEQAKEHSNTDLWSQLKEDLFQVDNL